MTTPLAAVLFDCDGTLADTEPLWGDIEAKVLTDLGGTPSPAMREATTGASMEKTAQVVISHSGRTDLTVDGVRERLTATAAEYIAYADFDFMPGVVELLTELTDAGVPVALVSASDRIVLDAVLSRLPQSFFEVIVGGDSVSTGKPDPEGYLLAARTLGVDPTQCVVIEDTTTGAAAGNAAGCWVLVVGRADDVPTAERRTHKESLTGVTVADLAALLN